MNQVLVLIRAIRSNYQCSLILGIPSLAIQCKNIPSYFPAVLNHDIYILTFLLPHSVHNPSYSHFTSLKIPYSLAECPPNKFLLPLQKTCWPPSSPKFISYTSESFLLFSVLSHDTILVYLLSSICLPSIFYLLFHDLFSSYFYFHL